MTRFLEEADRQGVPSELVQAYRSPAEQTALYTSGQGVTNAPALMSYHNYGLAGDVVPKAYLSMKDWNPSGPLWQKLGAIGESLGLSWGGRWSKPDLPHFEAKWAPLSELKAYWDKFQTIMPIKIEPAPTAMVIILLIGAAYWFWLRPMMRKSGVL
jgi:peptidoglycan L-alanyl-D-glutamate endopeptidase CwlK